MNSQTNNPPATRLQQAGRRLYEYRWLHFLLIALTMTALSRGIHLGQWRWPEFLDNVVLDKSFQPWRGPFAPEVVAKKLPQTRDIIIVELTHAVPRQVLADLIRVLREARVIALDLMLVDGERELKKDERVWYKSEIRQWRRETTDLEEAFHEARCVVVGMWPELERRSDPENPVKVLERRVWQKPPDGLWNGARYRAHLWVTPDLQDGIVRRVPLFENTPTRTPCLGLAVAAAARGISSEQLLSSRSQGGDVLLGSKRLSVDENGLMLIDYVGGRSCFETLSNRVVYDMALTYDPIDFRDKIVFIGETDFKAKDMFTTPFGDMAGVLVHANIVGTLLSPLGPPIPTPHWMPTLLALLLSVSLVVPLLRYPLWASLLFAGLEIVLVVVIAFHVFCQFHAVLPVSIPMVAIVLTYNAIGLYEYGRTRFTLGRFIGQEMVPRMMNIFSNVRLGGQLVEASAFFCDLRGYTTLSEQHSPETISQLLNEYTNLVVFIVHKHRGRPIDFLGDGVFVLFEQPLVGDAHALKAVKAALEIQQAFPEYRERWAKEGIPGVEAGIAIHSGEVVIGVVGSEDHMKLGAVGDVVNVASRVQGLSRECGYGILLTQDTYDRVQEEVPAVYCGTFPVKGRAQAVPVYGVGVPSSSAAETM